MGSQKNSVSCIEVYVDDVETSAGSQRQPVDQLLHKELAEQPNETTPLISSTTSSQGDQTRHDPRYSTAKDDTRQITAWALVSNVG